MEVYSKVMGGNMMRLYEKHKEELDKADNLDENEIKKCKYLYEFDR